MIKGRQAGHVDRGRRRIGVCQTLYPAATLAWLIQTGRWPTNTIDHRNRKSDDNRWENLREATNAEQGGNRNLFKNNTSGLRGVQDMKNGRWRAMIGINRKLTHLGCFATKEEAYEAYRTAARKHFGEYFHDAAA